MSIIYAKFLKNFLLKRDAISQSVSFVMRNSLLLIYS